MEKGNEEYLRLYCWCRLQTTSKPFDAEIGSQIVHLEKDQFIYGVLKASDELGIARSTLHRHMKKLEKWGLITIQATNKFSIITIVDLEKVPDEKMGCKVGIKKAPESLDNQEGVNDRCSKSGKQNGNQNGNIPRSNNIYNRRFGEFENVLLTDEEYEKLRIKYPDTYNDWIEKLSVYIESTGKKYKSHYATILNWSRKDISEKQKGAENGKQYARVILE